MEDLENSLQISAIEYYKEISESDPEELIQDAKLISSDHLLRQQKHYSEHRLIYKKLKQHKSSLKLELEIIDREKISALESLKTEFLSTQVSVPLTEEIQLLENSIIKFKLLKAELMQKLENLEDLSQHWRAEMVRKKNIILGLKKDMERYTEYRNSIQKVIHKYHPSPSNSTASNSSSFSVQNTPMGPISSYISDRSTGRASFHSAHRSLFY